MVRSTRQPIRAPRARTLALSCAIALACSCGAAYARGLSTDFVKAPDAGGDYSATLEQCMTAAVESERTATFTGQMTAAPGTQRMEMRIELQEHTLGTPFHSVSAPGLGSWRGSEPGVTIYKYVKQVTNLEAPAVYRAIVVFRWLGDHDRVLKHAMLHTSRCYEPLPEQPAR